MNMDRLDEILALARQWRDQQTDYDEDTERQITDGLAICNLLGDPCPHVWRQTTEWNPDAPKTWPGLLDHIPLPPEKHSCWFCGQVGNLGPGVAL